MTTTLVYGPQYSGRAALAEFCSAHYDVGPATRIEEWDDIKEEVKHLGLESLEPSLRINRINDLYDMCVVYICEQEGIDYPSKTLIWNKVRDEFAGVLFDLSAKVDQLWLICDQQRVEIDYSFYKGTLVEPKMDWVMEKILPQLVDRTICIVPTYATKDGKRVVSKAVITQLRPDVYAGDNTENPLPPVIPYEKFKLALNSIDKG